MRRLLLIATLLTLPLGACGPLKAITGLTQTSVSQRDAVLAIDGFDAVEITGTNYLRLRRCDGTNGPICRDPAVSPQVIAAVRSGRSSRNNLKASLRASIGQNTVGAVADYNALTAVIQTIKAFTDAYTAAAAAR